MATCKFCKSKFEKQRQNQIVCSFMCSINLGKLQREKDWKQRKTKMKANLKTKQDFVNELQVLFNRFIRQRDGNFCFTCDKIVSGKVDASHLYSVGNYPSVRFNELNVHSGCIKCNRYNGGMVNEYRLNFVKKYGQEKLDELDHLAHQDIRLSIDEVQALIIHYKKLLK